MKKGFTLIELLVTIVIIGLVAMIAYPAVGDIITSMKERSFVESRKGLIRAAKLYMEANQDLLPYNTGDITEIPIATLVSDKFIKEVKSPADGSTCGGYILIRQNEYSAYDYYPQYRCGASSSITSRETDSLVLDYTFDDFQEPTVNLISDVQGIVYTGYTGLLIENSNDSNMLAGNSKKVTLNSSTVNSAARLKFGDATNILPDRNYYYTIYIKKDPSVNYNIIPRVYSGVSWYNMVALDDQGDNYIKNEYRRFGAYIYTGVNSGGPNPAVGAFNYTSSIGDIFYFSSPQLEEKDHATNFTIGTRTSSVTDYSGNSLSTPLPIASTPTWVEDGVKGGAYKFNANTLIDLPLTMNNTNYGLTNATYTHSFWLKLNQYSPIGNGLIFGMAYYNGFGFQVNSDGVTNTNIRGYFRNSVSSYATTNKPLNLNEWYHLVLVLNKPQNKMSFYVNGELHGESTITNSIFAQENYPFALNRITYPAGNAPWTNIDGYMDEVKVFNRVLADDEIKSLYYMERVN
jgi:prepilin-type N-terminal cleavage/methylation domain-containing protein